MEKRKIEIQGIPSILWGEGSDKLFIAVHGNMSSKEDTVIRMFAEEAVKKGYGVISFDLPEHGERKGEDRLCSARNCVEDLNTIYEYAEKIGNPTGVFACSMGAYFSLLAYAQKPLEKCLFLSPVVDMKRIIENMMKWFGVTEERLKEEKEIQTPVGQTLYWDYYSYVKENPVGAWNKPTSILYGAKDELCEFDTIQDFVERNQCNLDVMESGEHYFHTREQLVYYEKWLRKNL